MSYHTINSPSELQRAVRAALRRTSTALIGLPGLALAGPDGGDVIRGAADIIRPDANTTTIDQHTDRAVINWQTFNVDADEYVIFNQLDSSSVVLNRVLSSDASYILGQMQANGQVFLLNPHGMFFGEGAVLDVQGFLGTTLDIANDDFMAGNYRFTRADNAAALGQVTNAGSITAGNGGYVMLAGDFTENTGFISAMGGTAALVSGNALTLDIAGDGLVNFAVNEATLAEQAGVRNAGSIIADGGMVVMTARVAHDVTSTVVNNEGLVRARSIEERNGAIWLVGRGGHVEQSGTLDANGENADGGRIILYGDNDIVLADGGLQTATGDDNHSGGTIRAIAEDHLDFQADNTMQATGGLSGGFVEVSGHGSIALRGVTNVGRGGTYLIDPASISIVSGSGTGGSVGTLGVGLITEQLNLGVNVVVAASNQITATANSLNATGSGDLTLGIGVMGSGTDGTCIGFSDSLCFGPNPTFTPGSFGFINVSGMDISIAGNVDIIAQQGTATVGEIVTTGGNITIEANNVTASYLSAGNDIAIDAATSSSNTGRINISGLGVVAGGDISMTATASYGGGFIDITGGMSAGGLVTLQASDTASFGSGAEIRIGNGILADSVDLTANGRNGNIFIENFSGVGIQATNNVSLTASGANFNGGRIEIGNNSDGAITGHDIISSNGNITISATNTAAASGGRINVGDLNAGGNINLSATGRASDGARITVGNTGFSQEFTGGADITAGGSVSIIATGRQRATVEGGNVTGSTITVFADGQTIASESGHGRIDLGKALATAGNVHMEAIGNSWGNAEIFTGALDAQGGNVHIEATAGDGFGASADLIVFGEVNATGHVDLYAGAAQGADTITVNGGITAGEYIYVWNRTNGNIGINGSVSGGDSIRIHAEGISSNQGMIGVAGNITGASVDIRAGGGEIGIGTGSRGTAFNGGDVTATTGNLSLALTGNTQSYGGGIVFAGDLLATNGNVNVSAATGEGRIELGNSSGGAMTTRANITAGGNINLDATGTLGTFEVGRFLADGNVTIKASGGITGTDLIIGSPGQFANFVTLNAPLQVTNSLQIWSQELNGTGVNNIGSSAAPISTVSLNTMLITSGDVNIYADSITGTSFGIGSAAIPVDSIFISTGITVTGDISMWAGAVTTDNANITVGGDISGAGITINADATAAVESGNATIDVGNVTATAGNILLEAAGNSFGNANILAGVLNGAGSINVDATGGTNGLAGVNIGAVDAGGNADIYASAILGDTIAINGNVTAAGGIFLRNQTDGNISVFGSVSGGAAVNIWAEGVSSNQGQVNINGSVSGTSVDIRAAAGLIDIGTGTREVNYVAGNITANTGNLSLTLTGNTLGTGGGIIVAGNLVATSGNATVSANTGQGHVHLGDYAGGVLTAAGITAGSNIDISASGSLAQIDVGTQSAGNSITLAATNIAGGATINMEGNATASGGNFFAAANGTAGQTINISSNIIAGSNIGFGTGNLLAFGGASHLVSAGNDITIDNQFTTNAVNVDYVAGGNISITAPEVFTGNLTAGGRVDLFGNGATFHSIGDVTAQHINAHFLPSGSGALSLTMGTLLATGSASGNRDVVVAVDGGSGASTATVNIADATAQNGDVSLTVFDGATGTPTGTLDVTGGVDAGRLVNLYATSNLNANSITAGGDIQIAVTSGSGNVAVDTILTSQDVAITAGGGITGTDLIIGSPDRSANVVTINSPILVTNSLRVWSNELRGPNIGTIGSASNVINTVSLNTSLITAGDVNIYAGNITGSSFGIGTETLAAGNVTINSNVDVSGDVAMWVGAAGNATVTVAGGVSAGNILISTDNNLNLAGNAFAATGNIGLDAGNGMNLSGTTLLASDVKAVTGTTLNANSAVIAADTVMLDAGTNMSVSNISLDAGQAALVAGGSITNSSPPGTITAGALAVLAGNTIDLGNTQLVIGSGRIAGVPGDERFLQLLAGQGVDVPTGGPNLVMRAQNIKLGSGTLAGDYVYLETDNLSITGEFVPSDPGLLLQIAPTGMGASFSLEQSAPGSSDVNYVFNDMLDRFNASTIALGSTKHTGDVTISNHSTNVDIDATNLFVLTNGTTTGLGKVLSTGIVKDLQALLNGDDEDFDVPQSDEIDITKDAFTSMDDQYGTESGGGDDEEGDEEGEDTADDTFEEEEDDSLIKRETAEEELMCE
jgi:filamentous hemagglutinin family protein